MARKNKESVINICFYRNSNNEIYSFEIKNHGKDIVCAAVSALSINAVNSIERFTELEFNIEYDPNGGYMYFEIPYIKENGSDKYAWLLLESFFLGIKGIKEEYGDSLCIIEEV